MRPAVDHIAAPPFPRGLRWENVSGLRMDQQRGRPVLVEFWDFCRPQSIRTLPYLIAWHERYADAGLRVIGVHTAGFPPSQDPDAVADAVTRLRIPYPVAIDSESEVWSSYENPGWPGRYLFGPELTLVDLHLGEGAYGETERTIGELLGVERDLVGPLRPEDAPEATIAVQTADVAGPYSGPYEAGGVWAVLDGEGTVRVNGVEVPVDRPGAHLLVEHARHTVGELELVIGPGVTCHATCFTPGVAG